MKRTVYFNSYEELSDYCYPFEKNLAHGISDEQRIVLLESIAKFYRQRLDEISAALGCRETVLVNVSKWVRILGRCCPRLQIIELDINLICYHPLALTEVIIHELTHYEYGDHSQKFYNCMDKYIKKLGLQQQIEQYREQKDRKSYREVSKRNNQIRKAFRISTKRNLYPPIPNGTLLGFHSFQELVDFCAPPYKNLPRVIGLLDRIKILTYAEHYYRRILTDLATRLQTGHDFTKTKIYITQKSGFFNEREIALPVWFIGLEETVLMNLFVRLLTERQSTDAFQRERKVKENLSLLRLSEERGTSIFLLDFFGSSWRNCFDANGGKVMEYYLDMKIP